MLRSTYLPILLSLLIISPACQSSEDVEETTEAATAENKTEQPEPPKEIEEETPACPPGATLVQESTDSSRQTFCQKSVDGRLVYHGPYQQWTSDGVLLAQYRLADGTRTGLQRSWDNDGILQSLSLSGPLTSEEVEILGEIEEVEGYVLITDLETPEALQGLSKLYRIGGNLFIESSAKMDVLDGFDALIEVGGDLKITHQHQLRELNAFKKLAEVGGDFVISKNQELRQLPPFEALTSIGGDFLIEDNPGLSQCDAQKLAPRPKLDIGGELRIWSNSISERCRRNAFRYFSEQHPMEGRFDGNAHWQPPRTPGTTILLQEPSITGSLDRQIIQRITRQHRRELQHCFEMALRDNPGLAGRIVMNWVVAPNGSVVSSGVHESTMNSSTVGNCMAQRIRRWRFPEPVDGGVVRISYPFQFGSPSEGANATLCDAAKIDAAIRQNHRQLRDCHIGLLETNPGSTLEITAWWLVEPSGRVTGSNSSPTTPCLSNLIGEIEFDAPSETCRAGYRFEVPAPRSP